MGISQQDFAWVADTVRRHSAIVLNPGKEYLVESRLLPLAKADGATDLGGWLQRARSSHATVELIVEALTTNETSWFRDNGPFVALRQKLLPQVIAERPAGAPVRIWSAACSSGQEPYSLAMTAKEVLPVSTRCEIVATDLSDQMLAQAKDGRYSQLEVNRGLPAQYLVRYLHQAGTGWQVNDDVRRAVSFRKHNLLDAPPSGPFQIVFLRNVLIYFDAMTKRQILDRVSRVLDPACGVLVLGAAETTIGIADGWQRDQIGTASVYRPATAAAAAPAAGAVRIPA